METFPPILIDIILKRWETLLTLVMIVTTPTDLNDFKMIGECMKCMFLPSDDYFLTLDDDKGSQRCSLWTEHKRQKAVYLFRFVRMESMMSENNDTFHVIYPHPPCALDPRETPGRQSRQDGSYILLMNHRVVEKCCKVKRGKASWEPFLVLFNFHSAFWNPVFHSIKFMSSMRSRDTNSKQSHASILKDTHNIKM